MISAEYAAGFFDGEGCVKIRATKTNGYLYYRVETDIGNTDRPILEAFVDKYGGSIYERPRERMRKHGWSRQYDWRIACEKAQAFLLDIQPYVRIKRKYVDLALEFHTYRGVHNPDLREKRKQCWERYREMRAEDKANRNP